MAASLTDLIRWLSGAPPLIYVLPIPLKELKVSFQWLTGHVIEPGLYEDPIQLIPLEIEPFLKVPRSLNSGHLIPLDRGGKHVPATRSFNHSGTRHCNRF
jgi:hypothetical protein